MREGKTDEKKGENQFRKIYAGVKLNRLTSRSLDDDDDILSITAPIHQSVIFMEIFHKNQKCGGP
jgi:hypothetical protein